MKTGWYKEFETMELSRAFVKFLGLVSKLIIYYQNFLLISDKLHFGQISSYFLSDHIGMKWNFKSYAHHLQYLVSLNSFRILFGYNVSALGYNEFLFIPSNQLPLLHYYESWMRHVSLILKFIIQKYTQYEKWWH